MNNIIQIAVYILNNAVSLFIAHSKINIVQCDIELFPTFSPSLVSLKNIGAFELLDDFGLLRSL